jgi:hypothetical protein
MNIYELNKEQKEVALNIVIKELERIGIKLDINHSGDRLKAEILATNLRMKFNQLGGLA